MDMQRDIVVRLRSVVGRLTNNDQERQDEAERVLTLGHGSIEEAELDKRLGWADKGLDACGAKFGIGELFRFLLQRRQGDVYMIPRLDDMGRAIRLTAEQIAKMTTTVQPLALGEISGHHHVVTMDVGEDENMDIKDAPFGDDQTTVYADEQGNMVLRPSVREDVRTHVEHLIDSTREKADHDPVDVISGYDFDVRIQSEYTPQGQVRVID